MALRRNRREKTARIGRLLATVAGVAMVGACVTGEGTTPAGTTAATSPGASPSPVPKIEPPTTPTTITFASWVGQTATMKSFAEEFQAEFPTITVEFQNVPAEQATQKLLTQLAGGTAPDTAFVDMSAVADFASRGALLNLEPSIAQSDYVDPADYVQAWKDGATFEGSLYGLPFDGETTGLFYRTDLFEPAGITEPPATWAEFEEAAALLTDPAKKQYGFIEFAPESAYYWFPFLWGAGGSLYDAETNQVAFDSPEGVEAAEFYIDLARKYSPPDFYNSNSWDGRVAFATGKVAMYMAGSWFAGEMQVSFPNIEGKWDTAPLPEGPAGCATTIAGDTLVVFEQSSSPEAAWLWIEFLSRPENMRRWNVDEEGSTLLPPRASLLNDPAIFEKKPVLQGFAENMECGVQETIDNPEWGKVEAVLNEKLGAAIYGDLTPAEALEQAAAEGNQILAAAG
jgi:multiple sugar transport system substrate-binding protein